MPWTCGECGRTLMAVDVPVKHNCRPRGLGDSLAKISKRIGVRPCGGCRKRQNRTNKLVPYRRPRDGQ